MLSRKNFLLDNVSENSPGVEVFGGELCIGSIICKLFNANNSCPQNKSDTINTFLVLVLVHQNTGSKIKISRS